MTQYEVITRAVRRRLAGGAGWERQKNKVGIVDISLNVGQGDIPVGADFRAFPADFIAAVGELCDGLGRRHPQLRMEPGRRLHSTLLTLWHDPAAPPPGQGEALCRETARLVRPHNGFDFRFDRLLLTANGSLILVGDSAQVVSLRERVYREVKIAGALHKNIVHITLGRLVVDAPGTDMARLFTDIGENRGRVALPPIAACAAKFVVGGDTFATRYDVGQTDRLNALLAG
ncbi:2'-5' RNA ligase family protein [Intestinirhabdus alba]|jgi:hypothetical protein|uniref:2'-5' RNA ligase n=1 Tax=Intestinirhabdus alba TaxID=2899544 RepID=A0A6L6IND8_9ENTR|nr:hypothetical protein [Intestinirhabdus alba]MTH48019.1 hypothetical protein [Intestinirhabdus alba]